VAAGAAVTAAAALAAALTAAPASAARNDPCATARAVFRSYMNAARFWIGAADRLAAAGNDSMANQATEEPNYYLGLAEGALGDMSAAC
jgi:hypothetical protein